MCSVHYEIPGDQVRGNVLNDSLLLFLLSDTNLMREIQELWKMHRLLGTGTNGGPVWIGELSG